MLAGQAARKKPPWQAWAFLALAVALNLAVGSLTSFSFWKVGFYRYFTACASTSVPGGQNVSAVDSHTASAEDKDWWKHESAKDWLDGPCWDHESLSSLYSWAVFGGFICILPGLLFDKFGPRVTTVYGLVLVNVGIVGMAALLWVGGTPPSALVGFFYFLEEQGAAAALYMAAVCVLVRAFPPHLVGVVSGLVAIAFGLSGLFWQGVAEAVFGFKADAEPGDTNLLGLLLAVLAFTDAVGVAMLVTAPWVQAAVESAGTAGAEEPKAEAGAAAEAEGEGAEAVGAGAPSVRDTLLSWNFMCLIALYSVASAQVIGMYSYLSSIPTAFDGLSSSVFTPIPFLSNVMGRAVYAVVVDALTRYGGYPGVTAGNVWINTCFIVSFLALASVALAGEGPAWVICLAVIVGFTSYGGGVCFASSFTKLAFPEDHVGMAIGLLFTVAAVSNTGFSVLFAVGNSTGSDGIDRVPQDFVPPWTAAFVAALCALPVTLLVAVRALRKRKQAAEVEQPLTEKPDGEAAEGLIHGSSD